MTHSMIYSEKKMAKLPNIGTLSKQLFLKRIGKIKMVNSKLQKTIRRPKSIPDLGLNIYTFNLDCLDLNN